MQALSIVLKPIKRMTHYLNSDKTPWTLRVWKDCRRGYLHNPVKAFRFHKLVHQNKLSAKGYNLQVYGREFLKTILKECKKIDMNVFLLWGSLLGQVREGSFIFNDHDIDLGVLERDFHKKSALRKAMLKKGFQVRIETDYKISFVHPKVDTLFIDIDLVTHKNDQMAIVMPYENDTKLYNYYYPKSTFRYLKTAYFDEDIEVKIPSGFKKFLTTTYGNWKVPDKEHNWLNSPLNLVIEDL